MPTCPNCGYQVPEGAHYCEQCWQPLSQEGTNVTAPSGPTTVPLRLGHYLQTAWHTFRQYPLGFLGFSLVLAIIEIPVAIFPKMIPVIGYLLAATLYPLQASLYIVSAKLLQRQTCRFADFLAGFNYFLPLMIFGLIYDLFLEIALWAVIFLTPESLPGSLGMLSTIVGGLGAVIVYQTIVVLFLFTPLLVIDRGLGLWEAMNLSRRTVQRRALLVLCLILLLGLLQSIKLPFLFSSSTQASVAPQVISFGLSMLRSLACIVITAAYADLFGLQSKEYLSVL
jgi:hypothetical protein